MRALHSLLFISLLFIAFGCKKDGPAPEPTFCWQVIDAFGNSMQELCNKTETEMSALYPNSCRYYKNDGEKSCWLVDSTFLTSMTQEGVELYKRCFRPNAGIPMKVDCNYCGKWYHREKRTYKPANTITYSQVKAERFCGDTAAKLYQGRQIVLRETADSLIVLQFSNNGTNW